MVSVIIPTHNRAWCLGQAIDSVLAQDYENFELLVVDDGSTDDTASLLAGYKDPRLRIFSQPNKGVSAARNLGIANARGAFIALLDSDDLWEPGKLSCQVSFFKAHPGAMICQTEEIWIRNGRRVNPMKKHKKPSGDIFEASLNLCLVSPSAVMMRKSLLDSKGGFREDFPVCEDYDLWLRIGMDTPIYLIDDPQVVKKGGHEDQLSRDHSQDKYRILSLTTLVQSGTLSQEQTDRVLKVLEKKCRIYGNGCVKRGRQKEGEYYLNHYQRVVGDLKGMIKES